MDVVAIFPRSNLKEGNFSRFAVGRGQMRVAEMTPPGKVAINVT